MNLREFRIAASVASGECIVSRNATHEYHFAGNRSCVNGDRAIKSPHFAGHNHSIPQGNSSESIEGSKRC
jgi:hypothetical protein